jgi:hypothetical protein
MRSGVKLGAVSPRTRAPTSRISVAASWREMRSPWPGASMASVA